MHVLCVHRRAQHTAVGTQFVKKAVVVTRCSVCVSLCLDTFVGHHGHDRLAAGVSSRLCCRSLQTDETSCCCLLLVVACCLLCVQLAGGVRGFVVAERRVDGNRTVCFHVKVCVAACSQVATNKGF